MRNLFYIFFLLILLLILICFSNCINRNSDTIKDEIYASIELTPYSLLDSNFYRAIILIKLYNKSNSNYCIPNAGLGGLLSFLDSSGIDVTRRIHTFEEECVLFKNIQLESIPTDDFYIWNWFDDSNKPKPFKEFSNEQKRKAIEYETRYYLKNNKNCDNIDTSFIHFLLNEKYLYSIFIPMHDSVYAHTETLIPTNINFPIKCLLDLRASKNDSVLIFVPLISSNDSCSIYYYVSPFNKIHDNYITFTNRIKSNLIFIENK